MLDKLKNFEAIFSKWLIVCSLLNIVFFPKDNLSAVETLIEAKASYFGATDSQFRKLYGNGTGLYGVEASFRAWKNLFPWISLDFAHKNGHSLGYFSETNIFFMPVGMGLKYMFPVKMIDFYTGIGGLLTFVQSHDHSHYVKQKKNSFGGGAICKFGAIFNCKKNLFLDFFGSYSWQFIPAIHHQGVVPLWGNLSGWGAGLAIGYRFGKN